jgi:ADP-heptose:LPS heptosyltransferase
MGRPEWSGIARGASHPHDNPERDRMHTLERQAEQLRRAGIATVPPPDVGWAAREVGHFGLTPPLLLVVPGGSAHRPAKRWPAANYGALAALAARHGVTPVVLGGAAETGLAAIIREHAPAARDLTGRTGHGEIVGVAKLAWRAIGNDTGPMHLIVAAGCPATVLYSAESDPALTAPRGKDVQILHRRRLADLPIEEVAATLRFGGLPAVAAGRHAP